MGTYGATIEWQRNEGEAFVDQKYSRGHRWRFDGGAEIAASSSPQIVPLPYAIAEHVEPEEAFVASLSRCHMLFFLSLAARRGLVVDEYIDRAAGTLGPGADGRMAMTRIVLRPAIVFAGDRQPGAEELAAIHHEAHKLCYIANSLKGEIVVESGG